jgi:hypothetical protein
MPTSTITTDTVALHKAMKHLDAHRGDLHRNSNRYRQLARQIAAAADPMAEARKIVRQLAAAQSAAEEHHLARFVNRNAGEGEHQITTATLARVVAELRKGYRGGLLDPQHLRLIDRYECEEVFTGRATLDSLAALVGVLRRLAVYDPDRQVWIDFIGKS